MVFIIPWSIHLFQLVYRKLNVPLYRTWFCYRFFSLFLWADPLKIWNSPNLFTKYRAFNRNSFLLFDWDSSSFVEKFEAIHSFTLWLVYFLVYLVYIRLYSGYKCFCSVHPLHYSIDWIMNVLYFRNWLYAPLCRCHHLLSLRRVKNIMN